MLRRGVLSSLTRSTTSDQLRAALVCNFKYPRLGKASQCARTLSTLPDIPLFRALHHHDPSSTAVVHSKSRRTFTYGNLIGDVVQAKEQLASKVNGADHLSGQRIAFLAENCYDYVVMLLSILASDAIALPLSPAFPVGELKYILDNSEAKVLLATEKYGDKAREILNAGLEREPIVDIRKKIIKSSTNDEPLTFEAVAGEQQRGGMMLYTSGTTNRPKGVLIPQSALTAQAQSLIQAWRYSPEDLLLHLLPLHHIHGTVNAILTPVLAGSAIEFMFPFNVDAVWNRLAAPFLPETTVKEKITFLTAVPTIYHRLMSSFPGLAPATQDAAKKAISPENLRLNISGSAALPTPTKQAWAELSNGNILLERYGMTEVGMAISCGLDPADRVDGSVGWPLPSVEARLWDAEKNEVIKVGEELDEAGRERVGEIQLRGPTIFREYFKNERATREAFIESDDGKGKWFRTGDVAVRRTVPGSGKGTSGEWARGPMYFIQGRLSVDIIKTGGEKVSALEVERELLSLPYITEAAVVGLPSEQWGQKVAAVVVLDPEKSQGIGRGGKPWGIIDMRRALKDRLAAYKIPQELKILEGSIPRNAMGKVNKKALVKQVFATDASSQP
ncbi:hypothetical protein VTN77DRAFT_2494 [Rasamsonia byssochlamydoides]|uniref:uncharacterized protein n=1 Tax=Rasamsonia byssochlamydoides TaxID=89139 RepID=UPI003744052F